MKLIQKTDFKNFYLPSDNSRFIVFSADTSSTEFDLKKAFNTYAFNFFLIIYKNDAPQINTALNQVLLGKIGSGRKIYWIDDLGVSDINSCANISITSKNQATQYSNIVFGKDDFKIYLKNYNPAGQVYNSTVEFDDSTGALTFNVNDNRKHKIIANKTNENEFDAFIIPLRHQETLFGFDSKSTANNAGSICFRSIRPSKNAIQPVTTLFTPNEQNKTILHDYKYFIDDSYSQNVDLLWIIYPTLTFDNHATAFHSYLELFVQQDLSTSFVDELGNNFTVSKGKSLVNRVAFVNTEPADPTSRNFFFIPEGHQSLDLMSPGSQMLLGNSGTERQNKTKLVFHESEELLYKEDSQNTVTSLKHGNSLTSIAISPDNAEFTYYMDSERASSFANNVDSTYEAIEVGKIKNNISKKTVFPVIPTLSFRGNQHLEELEKVLVKHRLKNCTAINTKSVITPNGFLKSDAQLNFINKEQLNKKTETDQLVAADKSNYRFSIDLNSADAKTNLDFNTSITKEDVFFVLTPKLLNDIQFRKNFNIFFGIHGFDIDLILENLESLNDTERLIVFKYSRYSVDELLEDTSKWSNYGKFKRQEWSSIQNALKGQFSAFEKKYNDGNKDYQYIDQEVRRNRHWNGVFILNVPILDSKDLPDIFTGLISCQELESKPDPVNINDPEKEEYKNKRQFKTGLKFQYVAFPVNKTEIRPDNLVGIKSTSFYGLIDYDLLADTYDAKTVTDFFPTDVSDKSDYKFLLTKLLVRFENSEIRNFQSFAFLQTPTLFDDTVDFKGTSIRHDEKNPSPVKNLVRLDGNYQKNGAEKDEFSFTVKGEVTFSFPADSGTITKILKDITLNSLSFNFSGGKSYRFNIDAGATFNKFGIEDIFNIGKINFRNIGLTFDVDDLGISFPKFNLSSLGVFPDIDFDGKGFLSSFPLKFNSFKTFQFPKISLPGGGFKLDLPNYDFFNLISPKLPSVDLDWLKIPTNKFANLFSFIFDFDLGTLGNLGGLKSLKAQLLVGWSFKGGFALGLKINGSSIDGLHIDLFGALKLDIAKLQLCKIKDQYIIRILDLRLEAFGIKIPLKENEVLNGIIFANTQSDKDKKTGWLITYISHLFDPIESKLNPLLLGIGQRVGIKDLENIYVVEDAITRVKDVFNPKKVACGDGVTKIPDVYSPDNNLLIASERFVPKIWRNIFDLKVIFNDPTLYGLQVNIIKYFKLDILYKKVSDNLGVYSLEVELPPNIRNIDFGGGALTLPNIGLDIFTNGDFMIDVGYPSTSDDWSRSALFQLRPFLGFAGLRGGRLRTASLSLFEKYLALLPEGCNIIQGGIALRVGIGAYVNKGIFYAGASITVYGILDGALAFNKEGEGMQKFFPDHFALRGRIGAIAEVIGCVDFKIVKASVHIILRVEFGILLAVIRGKLQPVPVYIEGEVKVSIEFTIACFRIFRRRICITIHLSFRAYIRFPYTIGGDDGQSFALDAGLEEKLTSEALIEFGEIPMIYIPGITKTNEGGSKLIHQFAINLFGYNVRKDGENYITEFSEFNVLKDNIIKPVFEAIFKASDNSQSLTYNFIRSIFLEGKEGKKHPFNLNFSKFKPTLLVGYNQNTSDDKEILQSAYYRFNATESQAFTDLVSGDPCVTNEAKQCPFRPIPFPVTSTIKVKEKGKAGFETDTRGFKIKLSGLFQDSGGNEVPVETSIKDAIAGSNDAYTLQNIEEIESHFDSYMTQFLERPKSAAFDAPAKDLDIRKDAITPGYFKLLGLLTLESCYNKFINQVDKDQRNAVNPTVSIEKIPSVFDPNVKDYVFVFQYTKETIQNEGITTEVISIKIKPNEILGDLVGQLNYFYNNGLRLPDVLNDPAQTKAFYDLIKQAVSIQKVDTTLAREADIEFSNHDGSSRVSLKDEMFSGKGQKEFVDSANKVISANLSDVTAGIHEIASDSPFELVNVKLPVSNSNLNTKDKSSRFFSMPDKIKQFFGEPTEGAEHYRKALIHLHSVSNSESKDDLAVDFVPCVNISLKVKPHFDSENKCKVLEIVNVYIDDLELMHKLKALGQYEFLRDISVYLKTGSDLVSINDSKNKDKNLQIIKTNLSPKTHPPVIDNSSAAAFMTNEESFMARLDNYPEFTRILWEAVTTNNSGFFMIEDKDADFFTPNFPKPDPANPAPAEHSVVFSFEAKPGEPFYGFTNFIKASGQKLDFSKLDENKNSLYAEVFSDEIIGKDKETGQSIYKSAQEYHSKIPAHCFGFSVKRTQPKKGSGYEHYVPLEFDITHADSSPILDSNGKPILTSDTILPLMPQNEKDKEGNPVPEKWIYNHVSPLMQLSENNYNRYALVGKSFLVSFGVRDSFGYRAAKLNDTLKYTHQYFDKLIPLNAWPFITSTYWFDKYKDANTLNFHLNIRVFENKDLSGYGDRQEIKTTLDTVIAQLTDERVHVQLVCNEKNMLDLKAHMLSAVKFVRKNIDKPINDPNQKSIVFEIPVSSDLKYELSPFISIKRKAKSEADDVFMKVDDEVWDAKLIYESLTHIQLANPDKVTLQDADGKNLPQVSILATLNEKISKGKCTIGMSSRSGKKIIYLLNKEYLSISTVEASPLNRKKSYYAIKPYSNKLWSGSYSKVNFSNVDLDKGLSLILSKIDDLLAPSEIKQLIRKTNPDKKNYGELLVACKKLLVEKELKNKTGNIDVKDEVLLTSAPPVDQSELRQEFRSLLLERLNNFYRYDGIVSLTPTNTQLDKLRDYRLSLSMDAVNGYNLVSSKIHITKGNTPKWFVLFDQTGVSGDIDLELAPKITHLEFDIKDIGSEIQQSTWIQLLTPLSLPAISIKDWPFILRKFPVKPQILKHEAKQPDGFLPAAINSIKELGEWQYRLDLKGEFDPAVDRLDFKIKVQEFKQTAGLLSEDQNKSFPGFIAYWSAIISNNQLKAEDFIDDLYKVLTPATNFAADAETLYKYYSFIVQAEKNAQGTYVWKYLKDDREKDDKYPKFNITVSVEKDIMHLLFSGTGFNIFEAEPDKICSILPEIIQMRNYKAKNDDFVYTTEMVSPVNWATPHIKFFSPIKITDADKPLQKIFAKMKSMNLPYKATSRLLINTADLDVKKDAKLPVIPIAQMEFKPNTAPALEYYDTVFQDYKNGYPAISVTVYNNSDGSSENNDLPIFFANTIYKKSQ